MKKIIHYVTQSIRPPLALLLTLIILFIFSNVHAQDTTQLSPAFKDIAKPQSTKGWIYFWETYKANPKTIFEDLKDAFRLSKDDRMVIKNTAKDELGFTHYRYQQYYKGIPVLYGEYTVHEQGDGFVNTANGRLITGIKAANVASISEKQALDAALRFMGAGKYLWQNLDMEKELKRQEKNEAATYFPKGDLVFAPANNDATYNAADYRLTWHFKIYTDDGKVPARNVYVDVLTGKVVHYTDISMNCSGGTGNSTFNGSVSISTELYGSVYRSHNNCQSTNIYVYNCNRGQASNTFYTDADNSWISASAVQAQWGAKEVYSYYLGQHSRTSWDNAAGDMIAYNNAVYGSPPTANNACWGCTGNSTIFGAGSTTSAGDDWNTDDIMGHEFTHGVTQSSANLDYNKESGALNESFSDIFGEMVESWAEGNCDYLEGADRTGGPIRSFINPKSYGQPDTYGGTNWYSTTGCTPSNTNDNCGVHTNSGVQNHWFYLLSEGGSGVNDLGQSYSVAGITRFKARLIAYRALTVYLNSTSQYIDSRKATLQAAYDLYGQCSPEIIAVGDAWHAVGVESQSPAYTKNVCGSYPFSGTFVQAISKLTASAGGCSTIITASSSTVYFTARDQVILYPGFTATAGSNFVAYLEPCSSTMWRTVNPPVIMSDAEKGIKAPVTMVTGTNTDTATVKAVTDVPTEGVSVNPNPFTATFIVSVNAKQDTRAQVVIYNAVGAKVKEQTNIHLTKGLNKIPVDGASLSQGVYMLEISFDNSKTVKKIVKLLEVSY